MHARRFTWYGALFGLSFPVFGTLFQAILDAAGGGFLARLARAQSMPLMWIIDTAPIFLGIFARLAGQRQDELVAAEASKRVEFAATARELFTGAQSLLSTVSSFSSMSTETAASVRETTATMQQLGHTAAHAALTAETVVGMANATRSCSDEGLKAVELSIAQLMTLCEEVRLLASSVELLNVRMRDTFEIASVITYLSDRSERLAESARTQLAAHQGTQSFAGIVEEMRRQAEDARRAAAQVKGNLNEMHKAMVTTLTAAQNGVRRAEYGAEVAGSTAENIKRLATALRDSSQAAKEIAMVAQQQDHGIDQVMKAMNEIFLASEETMVSTQRVANEAKALNDVARRLEKAVPVDGVAPRPAAEA
jgi:methyl-accepting chemotaxis protein